MAVPPISTLLEELEHPLLIKANEQFAQPGTPHERIRSIDCAVLFKVKVNRWRGAVWSDDAGAEQPAEWLVAAGTREDGSPDDFYKALERDAVKARARYNATNTKPLNDQTYVGHLLPVRDDYERLQAETVTRTLIQVRRVLHELLRGSLSLELCRRGISYSSS